jgi:tRNA A-37 threonylcarbamoyl transferase component Bud32
MPSSAPEDWSERLRHAIREHERTRSSSEPSPRAGLLDDSLFGRIAVELSILKPEQLEECLIEQAQTRIDGRAPEIADLLVQKGWLKPDDLSKVRERCLQIRAAPRIPRYEVREFMGEGATATVWRAWDRELSRPVALKTLKESAGISPIARERFHREAKVAAGLNHPNIVQVHDGGEAEGQLYLVMELVEGRPLSAVLVEGNTSIDEEVRLIEKVARGMAAAHEKGIVHRDLKPSNVLVTGCGEPKVADFGLAHLMDELSALTRTGTMLGTPLYMAPEQVEGRAQEISPRTDVYALGVMLYEAVTGRLPHMSESVRDIYARILKDEPVTPRRLNARVSRVLEAIILKSLQKDPSRRYPQAGALADDLGRCLEGKPVLARGVSALERLWRRVVRQRAALVPAAAAVLGAGLAWVMGAPHRPGPQPQARVLFSEDFEKENFRDSWPTHWGTAPGPLTIDGPPKYVRGKGRSLVLQGREGTSTSEGSGQYAPFTRPADGTDRSSMELYVCIEEGFAVEGVKMLELASMRAGSTIENTYGLAGTRPTGTDRASISLVLEGGLKLGIYVYHLDQPEEFGQGMLCALAGFVILEPGRWYCLEFATRLNTPGAADGEILCWVDGALRGKSERLRFRTVETVRFRRWTIDGYYAGSPAPRDQRIFVDDVTISTVAPARR